MSPEAKADLAAQAEQEMYNATAKRLVEELRINNSGVSQTAYHMAKQIEATHLGRLNATGMCWCRATM